MKEKPISGIDAAGSHTLQVISRANRFNRWIYDAFRKQLKGEVLETGSGIGNISGFVIADNFSVTLSDHNPEYCEWLKKNFSSYKNVKEVLRIDILHENFEQEYSRLKEKYDSIFLLNVIEHLQNDETAIENCRYLLKPGGHLIVLAPAYQWLYCNFDKELGHYRRYTLKTMCDLLQKNEMQVISRQYFNFPGIAGWLLFGKLLRRKLISNGEMSVFNSFVPVAKWMDKLVFHKAGLSIIVTSQKK